MLYIGRVWDPTRRTFPLTLTTSTLPPYPSSNPLTCITISNPTTKRQHTPIQTQHHIKAVSFLFQDLNYNFEKFDSLEVFVRNNGLRVT